jgi:hypothetical protein
MPVRYVSADEPTLRDRTGFRRNQMVVLSLVPRYANGSSGIDVLLAEKRLMPLAKPVGQPSATQPAASSGR